MRILILNESNEVVAIESSLPAPGAYAENYQFVEDSSNRPVSLPSVEIVDGVPRTIPGTVWEFSLAELKARKLERLKEACEAEILQGITSDALGTTHHYDCDPQEQLNIANAVQYANITGFAEIKCTDASGTKAFRVHTKAQVEAVFQAGATHIHQCRKRYAALIEKL